MNRGQLILENQVSSLKKKVEETGLQAKKKAKEMRSMIQRKLGEARSDLDTEKMKTKAELESLKQQVEEKEAQVTECKTMIAKLRGENDEFKG